MRRRRSGTKSRRSRPDEDAVATIEEEERARFEAGDFDGLKSAADFDGVGIDNRESDVSSSNHHHPTSICAHIFPSLVKLYVYNDVVAALASGTMGKLDGCVLISSTGSEDCMYIMDVVTALATGCVLT
ncbi:hypothetical protein Dimus_020749 [Dionaea muscipula]